MAKGGSKVKEKLAHCGGAVIKAFTLNIPSYFLWSGAVYLATAVVIVIFRPQAQEFLCDIWVEPDQCKACAFDLLTCPKGNCYRHAMNLTILTQANIAGDPLFEDYKKAIVETHCTLLVEKARNPVHMAELMRQVDTEPDKPDAVSDHCIRFHCAVLWNSFTHTDLVDPGHIQAQSGCTSDIIKHRNGAGNCPCSGQFKTMGDYSFMFNTVHPKGAADYAYSVSSPKLCDWITTTTTTTLTTTTVLTTPAPATPPATPPTPAPAASGRRMSLMEQASPQLARQLSHIEAIEPPPDAVNEQSPEFTVGEWGKCKCYQQCQTGIKSRPVSCLAGTCKVPKPISQEKCECSHCAACSVAFSSFLFFITAAIQGVLNLFIMLAIVYMNSLPETNLVRLSWGQWFMGFFVKNLPPLLRLIVCANMGQALFMMFQVWVPSSIIDFQPDCNATPPLQVVSIFLLCVMIFQIGLGFLAQHFNRMYPYLFKPMRKSKFRLLRWIDNLQRSLGP